MWVGIVWACILTSVWLWDKIRAWEWCCEVVGSCEVRQAAMCGFQLPCNLIKTCMSVCVCVYDVSGSDRNDVIKAQYFGRQYYCCCCCWDKRSPGTVVRWFSHRHWHANSAICRTLPHSSQRHCNVCIVYFHRDVVTYLIPKLTDQVVLPRRAWFCPIPNASFQSVVTSQYTSYIRLFITVGLYSEPVNHQPWYESVSHSSKQQTATNRHIKVLGLQ